MGVFSFSLLHTCKIYYDTLHDPKVVAQRATKFCDMLVPIGKKQICPDCKQGAYCMTDSSVFLGFRFLIFSSQDFF